MGCTSYLYVTCALLSVIWSKCVGDNQLNWNSDTNSSKFLAASHLVGCYQETPDYLSFSHNVTNSGSHITADLCVDICLAQYFRYAFFGNAEDCYCASSYGRYSPGNCPKSCTDEKYKSCENNLPNSVFDTGQRDPGPPASLNLFNATDTSVQVMWTPPIAQNDVITGYIITAKYITTYFQTSHLSPREWMFPNTTLKTELPDLQPGTEYNISVAAHCELKSGVSISAKIWTEIGDPSEPQVPQVIKRDKGQILIKLTPAVNDNGPITAYRIVVVIGHDEPRNEYLKSFQEAEAEGLPYYIAAELNPKDLKEDFVVGDGITYGKYYNPPLPLERDIHITLGIVSSLNGITKFTYAKIDHSQHDVSVLTVGDITPGISSRSTGLIIGLSVAIGICGFLLVLSVIAYCMIRKRLGRRRRHFDHQELSLQGPMIEVESNGYIHNGFIPEEEEERVNHYENLKRQVWNIPRNFLDVKSEKLGTGRYGNVMKGTVQQRGFPVLVAIHVIADGELPSDEKKSMLQDLGVLIRLGMHANFAGLIGTCESPDTLFVVVEHHPASLKDMLLESRCLEHAVRSSMSDTGRSRQQICSLAESQVLEAAVGIAMAMDYLHSKKIIHTHLAARNVLMADGVVPKITGCGIARYRKCGENPDYTRWTAQEIFRGRPQVSKSDVWSFGCLLWEISALGGTPYADIPNNEVAAKVMRGHRLTQLQLVDDDLYQLMLQCWQLDLDERPTFQEITHILENMLKNSTMHLNFEGFVGFHYEQYIPELEESQP